jgi:hypothetical protein
LRERPSFFQFGRGKLAKLLCRFPAALAAASHRHRSPVRRGIQGIVITANLTPRKCLGFKTPFQAILKELGKEPKSASLEPVAPRARIYVEQIGGINSGEFTKLNHALVRLERFWTGQIRYRL